MSQVSGSIAFEFPTERIAREVAASVIEHLGSAEVLDAIGAAVARRLAEGTPVAGPAEPASAGGYPLGRHHAGPGADFYDRGADL